MPAGRGTHTLLTAPQGEHSLQHALEAGKLDKAPDTAVTREDGMPESSLPHIPSIKCVTKFLQITSVQIRVQVRAGTEMLGLTRKHIGLYLPLDNSQTAGTS